MKIIKITRVAYFIGILFLCAQLSISAQVKPDQLRKLEGEWVVVQKHKHKYRGEHKIESESTSYNTMGANKVIYTFQAPNILTVTEIENEHGKQETEIEHYEI